MRGGAEEMIDLSTPPLGEKKKPGPFGPGDGQSLLIVKSTPLVGLHPKARSASVNLSAHISISAVENRTFLTALRWGMPICFLTVGDLNQNSGIPVFADASTASIKSFGRILKRSFSDSEVDLRLHECSNRIISPVGYKTLLLNLMNTGPIPSLRQRCKVFSESFQRCASSLSLQKCRVSGRLSSWTREGFFSVMMGLPFFCGRPSAWFPSCWF